VGNRPVVAVDPAGLARTAVTVNDVKTAVQETIRTHGGEHVVVVAPNMPNITVGQSAKPYWVDSFSDIPRKGPDGGPVRVLEIIAHFDGITFDVFGRDTDKRLPVYDWTGITVFSARAFAHALKNALDLDDTCIIILNACNIGNRKLEPSLAQEVATATGAVVFAAGGFGTGSFFHGNAETRPDDRSWDLGTGFQAFTFHQLLRRNLERLVSRIDLDKSVFEALSRWPTPDSPFVEHLHTALEELSQLFHKDLQNLEEYYDDSAANTYYKYTP